MSKSGVLGLLLLLCNGVLAQVVTIKDQVTEEPIEMATLVSEEPKAHTLTNVDGQADISSFQDAEKIEIRVLGYETKTMSFEKLKSASFSIRLKPTNIDMDEIVVSATRWNQTSTDVPSRIVGISPKEAFLQNPQTAADLLNVSGSVFIQKSQQGGGSPMIRGFATNRLLYSVDGVRMNTAIFRGGNIQNVISLDPFAIEHTEIFFGPGSVIYGSDAIGGVMSFQTLTPQLSPNTKTYISGKAVTRYASANNEKTGHLDINAGWEKWAMITSFSTYDYGDLRMGEHGPDEYLRSHYVQRHDSTDVVIDNGDERVQKPSGYTQINMMQKVRFQPNSELDLEYGFHYSETSDYSRYDRHIRTRNDQPIYGEWYYGPQKWMMNHFDMVHRVSNDVYDQMNIRLAHQFFEESRISRGFNDPVRERRIEEVQAYSANVDLMKTVYTSHKLYYGVEAVYNDVTSTGIQENITNGITSPGPSRYPQAGWSSYGAYISYKHDLSEKMLLQSGVRYNQYQLDATFDTAFYPFPFRTADLNKGALTGSLGFVYRPESSWVIGGNVSTAFRSPNVDDMGKVYDSEAGSVVVPNPDLEAEYVYNADIQLAKLFRDVFKVELTGYYSLLRNAMVRRDYELNGIDSMMYDGSLSRVQAVQNAANARIYGFQGEAELRLPAGFDISTNVNYQEGREELDDGSISPSRHAAPLFGVSRLSFTTSKLSMQIYVEYSDEKAFDELAEEEKGKPYIYASDDNGNPYSPAWYTLNFKALYQFNDHFSVSAGLENITDQRYRPYSSGIVAPGINAIFSLKAQI